MDEISGNTVDPPMRSRMGLLLEQRTKMLLKDNNIRQQLKALKIFDTPFIN